MFPLRGSLWGPPPLPEFLLAQLDAQGLTPSDAPTCIRNIAARPGPEAEAALFVDLGACKFLEGDVDGAIASWRHSISSAHDAPAARALLNLGLLYEHLDLHSAALGVLAAVAERGQDAQLAAAAMATARCQQAAGDGDDAMETMARLAQSTMMAKPDSIELAEVLYGLGEVAERAGRVDRAERAWRVASVGPESSVQQAASYGLVRLLLDQGHDDDLPEIFGRVGASAGHVAATIRRAETLARLGNEESATALLASIPTSDLAVSDRFQIAAVRLQIGLVNEAIDDLELLLGHDDAQVHHRASFTLGEIYRTYEMSDAAASMYQRVIDGEDTYWAPKALLSLGDVLQMSGDLDAARIQWAHAATAANGLVRDRAQQRITTSATTSAPAPTADVAQDIDSEQALELLDEPVVEEVVSAEPVQVRLADLEQVEDEAQSPTNGAVSEPIVVVLAGLDEVDETLDTELNTSDPTEIETAAPPAEVPNPYAALAPDGHESDVAPSTRNPYAELAPNFSTGDFTPSPDVQPGDWESMLDDGWPAEETKPPKDADAKRTSRAFSRYT